MKKSSSKYPPHIDARKLPKNVNFDPRGNGRWAYRKRQRKKRANIRIGDVNTTIAELWAKVDLIESNSDYTFKKISLLFQDSADWSKLSRSTQNDYRNCHKTITSRKTRTGTLLGDIPIDVWTPGAVRRYKDARATESKSRAAHEVRYIKRVFSWAISYDLAESNPAKEIRLDGLVTARDHYVQDDDYKAMLNIAPLKIALAAHLAYLTGRRRKDIFSLTQDSIVSDGILLTESKTNKPCLIVWSDELRELVSLILEEAGNSIYLFPGSPSEHYKDAAMDTAWQRVQTRLKNLGLTPFQFKDLRAKHATDFDEKGGDSTANLQHSSPALTRKHYLRKPKKVLPLR